MDPTDGRIVLCNGYEIHPHTQCEGGKYYHPDAAHSEYIIIHARVPIYNEQLHSLYANGARFLTSLDQRTCLCTYQPNDLEIIRALPWVVYANVYHVDLVVSADLREQLQAPVHDPSAGDAESSSEKRLAGSSDPVQYNVHILLHPNPEMNTQHLLREIAAKLDIPVTRFRSDDDIHIHAHLQAEQIHGTASIDHVKAIHHARPPQAYTDKVREIIMGTPSNLANTTGDMKFDGTGQIVAIADSGLDKGDLKDMHRAFNSSAKVKLVSVARAENIDRPNNVDLPEEIDSFTWEANKTRNLREVGKTNDPDGHGTHIAGIVLGNYLDVFPKPSEPEANELVWTENFPVKGIAPGARLYFQSIFRWYTGTNDRGEKKDKFMLYHNIRDLPLYKSAYQEGARIHNCSWGNHSYTDMQRSYSTEASKLDNFAFNQPDFLMLRAAGNGGHEEGNLAPSIAKYAAAKNCITVGMCYSTRDWEWERFPTRNTYQREANIRSPDNIPMESNRGPTLQGVIKPDLVAPGVSVYSAASRDEEHMDKLPGFWKKSNGERPFSRYMTGTSQACAVVAGAAACVRQVLTAKQMAGNGWPTSALIKAILINTATDLHGGIVPAYTSIPLGTPSTLEERKFGRAGWRGGPIGPAPNGIQGWGRVNLALACRVADCHSASRDELICGFYELRDRSEGFSLKKLLPRSSSSGGSSSTGTSSTGSLKPPKIPPSKDGKATDSSPVNDKRQWRIPVPERESGKTWNLLVHVVWTDQSGSGLHYNLLLSVVDSRNKTIYSNGTTKDAGAPDPSPYDEKKDVTKNTNVKHVVFENISTGAVLIELEAITIPSGEECACAVVWRLESKSTLEGSSSSSSSSSKNNNSNKNNNNNNESTINQVQT